MIVVRVELHAFSTREVTELARMRICNIGGTRTLGNYTVETFRGRSKADLDRMITQRTGSVWRHPRLNDHVWKLVAKALASVDYVRPRPGPDDIAALDAEIADLRAALAASVQFADLVANGADIDMEQTAAIVRRMPSGEEIAMKTWAQVQADARQLLLRLQTDDVD